MRNHSAIVCAAIAATALASASVSGAGAAVNGKQGAAALAAPSEAGWGKAIQVPGSAALSKGSAALVSVSCASAGNCGAGGVYQNRSGRNEAFVVSERRGIWHRAVEVPGTAALNKGGNATVESVSCGSAGNCAAGGFYDTRRSGLQAFVVSERKGTWHPAVEVPGTAALNKGGEAEVSSVSCASAGNCAAGGYYSDKAGYEQAFVVGERDGTWGKAVEVPGTAALNTGGQAQVSSVSCPSAGNCAAGGSYVVRASEGQLLSTEAFVVSERDGTWGKAVEVPGTAALNTGAIAVVYSVSCASAGNCAAGGSYRNDGFQAFVVSERDGTWGTAVEVPRSGALNTGGQAQISSVSCASAGDCVAGGYYSSAESGGQTLIVTESDGTWGRAGRLPGRAGRSEAEINSVSCASAGNCAAGGTYFGSGISFQAFLASEVHGVWGKAAAVPGSAALNTGGDAAVESVSCASAGRCSAGGVYLISSLHSRAFVVSEP